MASLIIFYRSRLRIFFLFNSERGAKKLAEFKNELDTLNRATPLIKGNWKDLLDSAPAKKLSVMFHSDHRLLI